MSPTIQQPVNLRHHIMSLYGITPTDSRDAEITYYAQWDATGFPVHASKTHSERITVTAESCHEGSYWSRFMLSDYVTRIGKGRCVVKYL